MRFPSKLLQHVLLLGGLGLFFGLLGPFGTFTDLAAPVRFAYWYGLLLFGYLAILLFERALRTVTRAMRVPSAMALLTLTSALPTTFAVAWVEEQLRLGQPIPPQVMPRVYASVAVVQLLMLLVMRKEWKPAEKKEVAVEVAAEPPAAAPAERPGVFWQRIPAHLGNELLAVTSEDHYLRIQTSAGSDLVLMRMGDAVTELASEDGMQVHRSWWVKRSAVVELRRSGARMELVLANGVVVPVSRSSQAAVRTAAWPSLASPSGQECV
jgi:hypothetical protein